MQPQYITLSGRATDITGRIFGRLTVLGPIGHNKKKAVLWLTRCSCGNDAVAATDALIFGNTQSCGCLQRERSGVANRTHGKSGSPIYKTWIGIIQRCTNAAYPKYGSWGGRGISICDEWRYSFDMFQEHVSGLPNYGEKGYTLDRVDNNGNYKPGNVRWATPIEQQRNRRDNHLLTHNGKTQCVSAWAEELGTDASFILYRLKRGLSAEEIFLSQSQNKESVVPAWTSSIT